MSAWSRREFFGFSALATVASTFGFEGIARAAASKAAKATYQDNIYTRMFGIRPVIGAFEPLSRYGNSMMSPDVMQAITELSEIFSIKLEQIYHELHQGDSSQQRGILSISTPSPTQRRRPLVLPEDNSPVFAPFDYVVPAWLVVPQAHITDAGLISMLGSGDLDGLNQLLQIRQTSPLEILEDNMTLHQVSYSFWMNCRRFISYTLVGNVVAQPK